MTVNRVIMRVLRAGAADLGGMRLLERRPTPIGGPQLFQARMKMPVLAKASAVVAALTVAAIAGCAGTSEATLTREEFIEQGNAICAAGNDEIEAAVPEMGSGGAPSGPEGEAFFETLLAVSQRQIDDLAALKAPPDMQPEVDAVVAQAREIRAEIEAAGMEALFSSEEDPFEPVNAPMRDMGLTACAGEPMGEEE